MYARAIASRIPASSTLHDLHAIFQLRGWHVLSARIVRYVGGTYCPVLSVLSVVGALVFADSVIVLA